MSELGFSTDSPRPRDVCSSSNSVRKEDIPACLKSARTDICQGAFLSLGTSSIASCPSGTMLAKFALGLREPNQMATLALRTGVHIRLMSDDSIWGDLSDVS